MKSLTIALKDLLQGSRSAFSLVFMFLLPLLITGMFYVMLGGAGSEDGFSMPAVKVVVANLDTGDPRTGSLGQTLADALQSPDLVELVTISTAGSAEAARQTVDSGAAGVAVIIPQDFSASFTDPESSAEIELYQDPTLTTGPELVRTLLNRLTENYAGVKITAFTALEQAERGNFDPSQIQTAVSTYLAASSDGSTELIELQPTSAAAVEDPWMSMVGAIMAGMMIFFAFFTGVNTASTLLKEEEEGTLPRLFTTPTRVREVLAGKFLAIGLTVTIQICVLLVAARLMFKIEWGWLPVVALIALGIVCAASAFGIFLNSLLKDTRQVGIVSGGVLTVTGMIGMMDVFTSGLGGGQTTFIPLLTPQGWAVRSMLLSMKGSGLDAVLPYVLALLAISLALFIAGSLRFQKRYA